MGLLRWLGGKLLAGVRLVLPMVGRAAGGLWSRTAFWVAHVVLVVAVLVGLGWLNAYLDLPRYLRVPVGWLARVWLPALFLLLYVNLWLGYWLWRLLRPGAAPSRFPDIDEAWAGILTALDRAGLDLTRVPLFLVLGRPRSGTEPMFRASGQVLNPMGPTDPDGVRAFAGPAGVFLLAPDCSLTGGLAAWADRLPDISPDDGPAPTTPSIPGHPAGSSIPSLLAPPPEPVDEAAATEPPLPPLTKNPAELDRLAARFRHLCGLIVKTRRPYCPVNGVLALVPEACTRTDDTAGLASLLVGRDLRLAAESLEVRCPVVGVVCDMEHLPGFTELVHSLPADRRGQRFGRRLPYAPRLTPAERREVVADSVRWVCRELVPRLTYRVATGPGVAAEAGENLVLLSAALLRRQELLARLFGSVFGSEEVGPVWAGGCYLAGTGRGTDQAGFLADIFSQLVEGQSLVAWTPAGRSADASLHRRAAAGYLLVALAAAGTVGLGVVTALR